MYGMLKHQWSGVFGSVLLACVGLLCGWGTAYGLPFDLWDMANPVVIDSPVFEQSYSPDPRGETLDDVIGNPFNADEIFVSKATKATLSTTNNAPGILKYTLTRSGGLITGGTMDFHEMNYLPSESSNMHNGKAIDMYDANTLFVAAEEGDTTGADSDGSLDMMTLTAGGTPVTFSVAADLSSIRNDGEAAYDPEGIAIDRVNNLLYVVTDDATDQEVTQYSIGAGGALTKNWTTTVASGVSNGNDATILPDGRVAVLTGKGSDTHVYAVTQDGATVTDLLGGPIASGWSNNPQDLIVADNYLYIAEETGILYAFDLTALGVTASSVFNLNALPFSNEIIIGGMGLTANDELLISTRYTSGSVGEIIAFNLDDSGSGTSAIPEPTTILLSGLSLLGLAFRRRKA